MRCVTRLLIVAVFTMIAGLRAAEVVPVNKTQLASKPTLSPEKLVASGKACLLSSKPADGLSFYRQAASAGSVEAVQLVGDLFLRGQTSNTPEQSVPSNIAEGVRWTFWAATNMHPEACRRMARIHFEGLAVKTNLVHAYAWMRLFSELDPKVGPNELNGLVRFLDPDQIQEAQELVSNFKKHQWPPSPCKRIIEGDSRLTLSGISLAGDNSLVVINRSTVGEGETAVIAVPKGQLTVTCIEISAQSTLVEIEGENEARLLRMR